MKCFKMTAIADADLDELWVRAQRAQAGTLEFLEEKNGDGGERPHGETSVYQDSAGDMVATTRHPDGTVETQGYAVSFTALSILMCRPMWR